MVGRPKPFSKRSMRKRNLPSRLLKTHSLTGNSTRMRTPWERLDALNLFSANPKKVFERRARGGDAESGGRRCSCQTRQR